jgi:hypothetical protein
MGRPTTYAGLDRRERGYQLDWRYWASVTGWSDVENIDLLCLYSNNVFVSLTTLPTTCVELFPSPIRWEKLLDIEEELLATPFVTHSLYMQTCTASSWDTILKTPNRRYQ